jgi:hypothetical protein
VQAAANEPTRPVAPVDLSVLIQLLAVLEGHHMIGDVPEHLAERIRDRFVTVGLLPASSGERAFRQAIGDLNQRLRYALREHDEPPSPLPAS